MLRKQSSVQVERIAEIKPPNVGFTHAVAPPVPDPFPKPSVWKIKWIRQVLQKGSLNALPITTITRFATCEAISQYWI